MDPPLLLLLAVAAGIGLASSNVFRFLVSKKRKRENLEKAPAVERIQREKSRRRSAANRADFKRRGPRGSKPGESPVNTRRGREEAFEEKGDKPR